MWRCVWIPLCLMAVSGRADRSTDEAAAKSWLDDYNTRAATVYYRSTSASWNWATNLTDHNQQLSADASFAKSLFENEGSKNTSLWNWKNFTDEDTKRQFMKISIANTANLPEEKIKRLNYLKDAMQKIYSTGKVCGKPEDTDTTKCYSLDPGLNDVLTSSRSHDQLLWSWLGWRDNTGKKLRAMFEETIGLQNEGANLDDFSDQGDYWRSWYEMDGFEVEVDRLWNQVKPMYQHVHAYVKRRLKEVYETQGRKFPTSGHIPAHLLGNMWAQTWDNIYPLVQPFANKTAIDVTPKLVEQNYTARRMVEVANEFFTSLGLISVPQEFWDGSMIERPTDREVVCHASAWDFYNKKDFRIKQCIEITAQYLYITHHELGHIQYYLNYKDLPISFRDGANPGFHEAIGDVMALSVVTPEHLKTIGLLTEVENDMEADINYLMSQALTRLSFLPFGFLVDQWRWSVYNGTTKPDSYNKDWWALRCKYQGIVPPVKRSEADFDPGAKFHIAAHVPYIRYFVSTILQFQIHDALCKTANSTAPLHRCDIYKSKEAGTKLGKMLALGSSKKWQDALEQVTGERTMDAKPIVRYFEPLLNWLKEQNKGQSIAWEENCPDGYTFGTPDSAGVGQLAPSLVLFCISSAYIYVSQWFC